MELKKSLTYDSWTGPSDGEISGVSHNSLKIRENSIFVAISGYNADGHDYISDALQKGARVVVCEKYVKLPLGITSIITRDSRVALAEIASTFYGHPSKELTITGITGTNGKTSTSLLLESILKAAGFKTGVIGTIGYRYKGVFLPALNTTPDALELQKLLRMMADDGVTHVVMEVSSHALSLHRVDSINFDAAVFTNFSQDHLDYHKTMDAYFLSKKTLFTHILPQSSKDTISVTNIDDPKGVEICRGNKDKIITFGLNENASVRPVYIDMLSSHGLSCRIKTPDTYIPVKSNLLGKINLYNILAAASAAWGLGIPRDSISKGIETLSSIPGRLEKIENQHDMLALVDYAHTPDALQNVLSLIGKLNVKRVICVFGCGGNRDVLKRPLMGKAAAELSDIAIITSDNPRSEDPDAIIRDIVDGISKTGKNSISLDDAIAGKKGYLIEPDRKQAIELGAKIACSGDALLVAGKGHEDYQITGNKRIHFDDREELKKALSERLYKDTYHEGVSIALRLDDIAMAVNGFMLNIPRDCIINGISTDTRSICHKDWFVALQGKNFNGNSFIETAFEKGVSGVIVDDTADLSTSVVKFGPVLKVNDTTMALGEIARLWRIKFNIPVIAITGSNGKTTTKEMVYSILNTRFSTLKNEGNLNNLIGLPKTLLKLEKNHRAAVVELGMNHAGEIKRLAGICKPCIGIITNIQAAHLEGLKSLNNIAKAKSELLTEMCHDDTMILNRDDPYFEMLSGLCKCRIVSFGLSDDADVQGVDITSNDFNNSEFTIRSKNGSFRVVIPLVGEHFVLNALAASATALTLGFNISEIREGLLNFTLPPFRMEVIRLKNKGCTVINDSYNANPGSMRAALKTVENGVKTGRIVAVLGTMLELGNDSKKIHRDIGRDIAKGRWDILLGFGKYAPDYCDGAVSEGMDVNDTYAFTDHTTLAKKLTELVRPEDTVLLKGSRGMKMEQILELIR